MKILKYISIVLLASLFACTTSNSPENVVKEFYKAIEAEDIEKAKTLASAKSQTLLDLMGNGMKVSIKQGKLVSVDCVTEKEVSNCDCFFDGETKPFPVSLIQENEKWKVDIQASAMNVIDNILENIDLSGLMEKVNEGVNLGEDGISKLLENIDVEKAANVLNNLDSAFLKTDKNLENLINDFSKELNKK